MQLLFGADYWRTVLDGAVGIDVYGNNGLAVGDFDNDGRDDLYVCQPAVSRTASITIGATEHSKT